MIRKQEGKNLAFSRPGSFAAYGAAIRKRREEMELTLDMVAAKTGISKPYLSNIETARAPGPPSEEKVRKLASVLGLSERELLAGADWLRTPESVKRAVGKEVMDVSGDGETISVRSVPMINRVVAGRPAEYSDMEYPAGIADKYVPVPDLPSAPVAAAFALRVTGDSMMPEYVEGEIVIVGPGEVYDGCDCVVRLGDEVNFATTFKRVFYERDAEGQPVAVQLVALNPKYAAKRVLLEEVTGIYPLLYRMVPARKGLGIKELEEKTGDGVRGSVMTTRVSLEND